MPKTLESVEDMQDTKTLRLVLEILQHNECRRRRFFCLLVCFFVQKILESVEGDLGEICTKTWDAKIQNISFSTGDITIGPGHVTFGTEDVTKLLFRISRSGKKGCCHGAACCLLSFFACF